MKPNKTQIDTGRVGNAVGCKSRAKAQLAPDAPDPSADGYRHENDAAPIVRSRSCIALYVRVARVQSGETSAALQEDACRRYAAKIGADVVEPAYADIGASGLDPRRRQLRRLIEDCEAGRIDIVTVSGPDRLSRSLSQACDIYRSLDACGVELHDAERGRLDLLSVTLRGLIDETHRKACASRIHHGRAAAMKAGRSCFRVPFGFIADRMQKGRRRPHDERAAVVRKIYDDVAAGRSFEEIAGDLSGNAPTPGDCNMADRGKPVSDPSPWSADMIRRIIANPAYAGWLVYGRTRQVRDSETGERLRRELRPLDEHRFVEVTELRLVDPAVWALCQQRKAGRPPV